MKGLIRAFFIITYIIMMLIAFGGSFMENMKRIDSTVTKVWKTVDGEMEE